MLKVTDSFHSTYPSAVAGALALENLNNPSHSDELDRRKTELENQLRSRYAGSDRASLLALPVLAAYREYYKRFDKTYHVLLQLESVAMKGKSIPGVDALVESLFMAELQNLLLTAGHDLDTLQEPITLDVASGTERFTALNGHEQTLKFGDMYMLDGQGPISSVIYGIAERTRITSSTRRALMTVYAPSGIGAQAVAQHFEDIQALVRLFSPQFQVLSTDIQVG
ncbi:MAG: phenylalanine--tRNA ligase beta subunit-related protein [Omnitrophica WOR_2 bacterium]